MTSRESRAVVRGSARRRRRSKDRNPPDMSDLRIVLLGKSVSGNSQVGNFLLGRAAFDSEAPPDVVERVGGRLKDRHVMVINCPQLLQTHISLHQITQTVRECVYLSDPGPHAFILVLQHSDFTEEDMRRAKHVLDEFSGEAIKRTIVLTTDGETDDAQGAAVKLNELIQQLTAECGGGHLQLDHEMKRLVSGVSQRLEKILGENSGEFLRCDLSAEGSSVDEEQSRSVSSLRTEEADSDGGVRATRQQKLNLVLCGSDETLKNTVSKFIREKKDVELAGRLVSLVELPALFNTRLSEEEVMRQIIRCVSLCHPGVHAFLLIVPVAPLNNEDKAEMEAIQRIFSSRINKHMMILIMQNSQRQTAELSEETQAVIESFGGRHHVFSPTTLVSTLMENIEQMLEVNRGEFFSTETFLEAQMKKLLKFEEMKKKIDSLEKHLLPQGSIENQDEVRIVLLGKTGVGKSATGNTILGRDAFTAETSQESVTKASQRESSEINGRHVTVIDTPGLFDTELTNEEIQREISNCISMILPGPHVFIIVLNLGQRFTAEEATSVKIIQETFGEKSLMFTMVLFTRGDDLKDKTIDQCLGKPGSVIRNLIEVCGNRFHVFNNNETGDRTQVCDLLEKIDNMVKANGGSFYSCKMFRQMEREKQEQQMKILMDRLREREEEMRQEQETFKNKTEQLKQEKEKLQIKYDTETEKLMNRIENERKKREEEFNAREERYKREIKEKEEREENMCKEMKREREEWEKQKLEEKIRKEDENEKRREKEQRDFDEFNQKLKEERERMEREKEDLQSKHEEEEKKMKILMEEERQSHDEERKKREEEFNSFKHQIEKITREKEKLKAEYETKRVQWETQKQDKGQKREEEKKTKEPQTQKSELQKKRQSPVGDRTKSCGTKMEEGNMMADQHLNLVLLGRRGAGKSASGNTILGRQAFISKKKPKSVTQDVAVESGAVGGITVTVYDTPGFCHSELREDEEIQQKYEEVLQRCESGRCVFLLVIKADRFTKEERKTVEKIEELLGEKQMKKTWILFTRGDELEDENMTIKEFIDDTEPLKRLVQKYEQRYHVLNNKKKGPSDQVKMLLTKRLKTYIDIQVEDAETLKQNLLMRKIRKNYDPVTAVSSLSSRRIALLGKTGAGKSAAGNTILGQKEFRSEMGERLVTSECVVAHATVSGRSVSVVDTPGFFDTKMKPEQLMTEIARSVYLSSPGPHAFLIVFALGRFTEHEQEIPQIIEMMFGQEVLKYSIILFTHGDQLEGQTVEELIQENCRLRDLVDQCGGRFHVFNNKAQNNREQVKDLLQKIDSMIEQNGGGHYSHLMFEDALRFRREEEEWRQREKEEQRLREDEERRQREEEEIKLQVERQIQEEIERVRKEAEERIRAEMKAELERLKAERQREEEQRKQREEKQKECVCS